MQDASKVVMGANLSTAKEVDSYKGAIEAGLVVRQKSDGTLSLAKADGGILGVSLGKDLSDAGFCPIVRKGLLVPVLLTASFTPVDGTAVAISDTTGMAKAYTGTGDSYVNAVYASGPLNAVKEDGTILAGGAALIDMVGGL